MKEAIKDIFKEVLELEHVDDDISKSNCSQWDSLAHLNLIVALESKFDVMIEPEDIEKIVDLKSVENVIKNLSK